MVGLIVLTMRRSPIHQQRDCFTCDDPRSRSPHLLHDGAFVDALSAHNATIVGCSVLASISDDGDVVDRVDDRLVLSQLLVDVELFFRHHSFGH